ncbi:hypothetical protein BaRGS_00028034, partial [Batillaria attramentaria]
VSVFKCSREETLLATHAAPSNSICLAIAEVTHRARGGDLLFPFRTIGYGLDLP